MPSRIALYGGSFNPPGLHHRRIAEALAERFDTVLVVPCGPRDDKTATNLLPAIYRAAMADIAFAGVANVEVDLFDLEQDRFTRSHELDQRYAPRGQVWHVVGVDLIKGGATGKAEIQRTWERGPQLWQEARFAVITRPGYELDRHDLPPHAEVIELDVPGSSSEIRDRLARGKEVSGMLTPRTLAYVQRYGLYRAPIPSTWARASLAGQAYALSVDVRNEKARSWQPHFSEACETMAQAQFVTILGGDGAMLRCIREHWRARLPFFGVNAGHLGFLMNRAKNVLAASFPPQDVIFRQLPMLYLECEGLDGAVRTAHGFNDAWVERATSQSAWLELKVNGVSRIKKMVSDGALVATAAGSTAYARSMGAPPLLADTPAWLVVGSNVMDPADWKSALLSNDSTVELRSLDTEHRPVRAFIDGHDQGLVRALRARISKAAAVELIFNANHDMAEKIAAIQFRTHGADDGE
jgi:NAD kinase/nicotinic acid mononucleotide adenylyltransferase